MRCIILFILLSSFSGTPGMNHVNKNERRVESLNQPSNLLKGQKIPVEIMVTGTTSYCGGAKPPPELLKKLETPKPLQGKRLYLKKGQINTFNTMVYLEICTDSLGKISIRIPEGKYFVVDEYKKDPWFYTKLLNDYPETDKNCLKTWYEQSDFSFEVKTDTIRNLTWNIHKNCSWEAIPCVHIKVALPQ
ncbi:MAG: hypothetical protein WCJ95_00400 [Mariniphaga sp.]